jgi:ADP-heptose:LPS heptosyltransferase
MSWLAVLYAQPIGSTPNAQIDYLVYESTTPVLEGNPNIDKYIA